ncbi:hypothetical protein [Methylobacterium sp. J-076]|uniref:hypothetical protein n=1 Tax=Methylobacterium sp. J-076 TaxID=2836655 RepID=UPI001FBBC990|nr:hypothetical protein [Methylobacterium sp. J-076]MCJ2012187.1 hypothetical protein [Methylobacterium sp. J-076]
MLGSTAVGALRAQIAGSLATLGNFRASLAAINLNGLTNLDSGLDDALCSLGAAGTNAIPPEDMSHPVGDPVSGGLAAVLNGELTQALSLKGTAGALVGTLGTTITGQLIHNAGSMALPIPG